MQDLSINAFIFKEISESTHSDQEKNFLRNLFLIHLDIEKSSHSLFCINFNNFIHSKSTYNEEAKKYFTEIVESALEGTNMIGFSARLIRTVELLGGRKSLSPIVDLPENWYYYEGVYYHKHNRDFTRDNLDSPIMAILDIHNFPVENYKYYQGYGKSGIVGMNTYLLDPYRKPWQHYHALPMKRELTLEQNINRPGMQIPEKYCKDSWLDFRRKKFLEFEEKRLCQK